MSSIGCGVTIGFITGAVQSTKQLSRLCGGGWALLGQKLKVSRIIKEALMKILVAVGCV